LNTAAAVRDNTGKIVRYQGALMDVTARRELRGQLHKEQEFARRLVDSFPDLILVIDTQGNYTLSARVAVKFSDTNSTIRARCNLAAARIQTIFRPACAVRRYS